MDAKDAGLAKVLELLPSSRYFPRAVCPGSAVHADWGSVITWLCQLEAVLQHGTILFKQEVSVDVGLIVGINVEEVAVVGAVVDLAQAQPVG